MADRYSDAPWSARKRGSVLAAITLVVAALILLGVIAGNDRQPPATTTASPPTVSAPIAGVAAGLRAMEDRDIPAETNNP